MSTKQDDVNYDDVQMEMSDDDGDSSSDSGSSDDVKAKTGAKKNSNERELFSNEADYRAYKNQFEAPNKGKNKMAKTKSTDYGTAERDNDASEYGGGDVRPEARPGSEKLKRLRQLSNEDFSAVVKESEEDRNLSNSDLKKSKKNFHEKDRTEKSSERHSSSDDRRHRREKSRSTSRERKKSKKDRRDDRRRHRSRSRSRDRHQRRHRSRSSSRERRHRQQQRDEPPRCDKRQELRNREYFVIIKFGQMSERLYSTFFKDIFSDTS